MQDSSHASHHYDADRLKAATIVSRLEWHDELPSTNDRALELANDPGTELPCLIVADRQAQGRGRGGNVWWSSPGALTFSLLLDLSVEQLPLSRWPEMSLTVGSSVCVALSRRLPGEDVRLKWPNDVYLRGAKVCGVLVEVPLHARKQDAEGTMVAARHDPRFPNPTLRSESARVVIGVGINVNNTAANAPDELHGRAIALCDVGGNQPISDILIEVIQEFARQLDDLQTNPELTRGLWRRFDLLTGRTVTIDDGVSPLTGTCLGIEDDGALLLQTEAGPRRCYGGVVQSFT